MDLSLKPCSTTTTAALQDVQNRRDSPVLDRLTTLPSELLIRILSLLPTKDVAVTSVLSKRMRRIFPFITTLDFDISPLSLCLKHPYAIECFPSFVNFVDSVLQAYRSQYLTRFRLRAGVDFFTRYAKQCNPCDGGCKKGCFPDLQFTQINAWISLPLTRCGLRELDICIQMREPNNCQLPLEIFMCETMEVLRLDVNLGFDRVSALPSFSLPNLKLLHLSASLISEDGFVTRLVSSCPLLEDLTVEAWWNHVHSTSISSPSLRKLCLRMLKLDVYDNTDFVLINTPNLEYLKYCDNLALKYSVSNMHSLVRAYINFGNDLIKEELEVSFQQMLNLIRPMSNVQHLSLLGTCMEDLNFAVVKDQLPVFPNLKYLELGYTDLTYWDKVLLAFLNCSPVLETLVFPEGVVIGLIGYDLTEDVCERERKPLELEQEFCRTAQAIIPWCCRFHLKRIVIKSYFGKQREVDLIQFLLRHALVLEELIVCRIECSWHPMADQMSVESVLRNLPRASVTCSIQVQ